jgi:hypothetical protein
VKYSDLNDDDNNKESINLNMIDKNILNEK